MCSGPSLAAYVMAPNPHAPLPSVSIVGRTAIMRGRLIRRSSSVAGRGAMLTSREIVQ